MYVRVKTTPNSPRKSVQIVEGYRDDAGKVKQKIVRHVGIATDDAEEQKLKDLGREIISKIEAERAVLASQGTLFPIKSTAELTIVKRGRHAKKRLSDVLPVEQVSLFDVVEQKRVIEGIHEVGGHVFNDLYGKLCTRHRLSTSQYNRLRDVVLARLADPCSKHKTQRSLLRHFDKAHDLDALYRMMDKVHGQIDMIKSLTFSKTQSLFPDGVDVLLFDVTTLYFESVTTDEIRAFGYSKDHRFNTTQVVLALATNSDGLPIGYELFSGNKAEVKTLVEAIKKWQQLFPIKDVCFIGDRAMMSKDNIALLETMNYHYVIAAKLKSMPQLLQKKILNPEYCTKITKPLLIA
jgi:transposase